MNLQDWLLKRYDYYEPSIRILGRYPIWKTPTLVELSFSKAMTQSAYKDIKTVNEKYVYIGDIVDFLCIMSTCKLLDEFERMIVTSKGIVDRIVKEFGLKDKEKASDMADPFNILTDLMKKNDPDSRNFLRVFFKNPRFILSKEIKIESLEEIVQKPQFTSEMARLFAERSVNEEYRKPS